MNGHEHLTNDKIAGYRAGAFTERETREIGRHLLQCAPCRKRLPVPGVEGFLSALLEESPDTVTPVLAKSGFSVSSISPSFSILFDQARLFAWGGAAVIILLSVSFVWWLSVARQSKTDEVAGVFAPELNIKQDEKGEQIAAPASVLNPEKDDQILPFNSSVSNQTRFRSKQGKESLRSSSRNNSEANPKTNNSNAKRQAFSSTRGTFSTKCGETTVATETRTKEETVQLRWKKIPKAAKYHLYVSDEEEILIDEFETGQDTSYVLKKALDPAKTYKWKIVVTLENGQTVAGDGQKFTVKNLRFDEENLKRKKKSDIRCLASN